MASPDSCCYSESLRSLLHDVCWTWQQCLSSGDLGYRDVIDVDTLVFILAVESAVCKCCGQHHLATFLLVVVHDPMLDCTERVTEALIPACCLQAVICNGYAEAFS